MYLLHLLQETDGQRKNSLSHYKQDKKISDYQINTPGGKRMIVERYEITDSRIKYSSESSF